jgi:hypothetical protein
LDNLRRNSNDLKKICVALKVNCYNRGAKDNLTAIVLRIMIDDSLDGHTKTIKLK